MYDLDTTLPSLQRKISNSLLLRYKTYAMHACIKTAAFHTRAPRQYRAIVFARNPNMQLPQQPVALAALALVRKAAQTADSTTWGAWLLIVLLPCSNYLFVLFDFSFIFPL